MIQITKEVLTEWFNEINSKYFNNELRSPKNYIISTNISRFGQFRPATWEVEMSTAWVRSKRDYYNTFLHELCHLYVHQKYGRYTKAHGTEWQTIANHITAVTCGKYGVIKRVGGGQDKYTLRNPKKEKFAVFIDYKNHWSFVKYCNYDYIKKLIRLNVVANDTKIFMFESNNEELCQYPKRCVNSYRVRWNYIPQGWTLERFFDECDFIKSEMATKLEKAA